MQKWADIKRQKMNPERIERVRQEAKEALRELTYASSERTSA